MLASPRTDGVRVMGLPFRFFPKLADVYSALSPALGPEEALDMSAGDGDAYARAVVALHARSRVYVVC